MYASPTESGRGEAAGRGAAGTILCRFVWPHGGRSVFVTGSFNRWTELIAMSPVEGCPRVFQAIHGIAPGYHQFKFFVDGDWKHDEQQPNVVTNDYGTVNTFPPEASFNGALSFQMLPAMNMDLDNEAFTRVVRVEDGLHVSEIDLQNYRERISLFLSSHSAYELLPNSGKVIALDVNLPVKQAFHILYEQGIPLAPLWDSTKSQFVGMLSSLDFILILKELGTHGSNLTEEELDTHTIYAWKEGKAYANMQLDEHGRPFIRPIISAGPYDSLKEVACRILRNRISTVPIIHSASEDGSYPQLLSLASLSGILKCICRYFKHCSAILPFLQLPICNLPVVTWMPSIGERPLTISRVSASLNSALDLFIQANVSCIPIVDENDSLVDFYCRSDITALAKDNIYTHINLNETTVLQALQLGQEAFSGGDFRSQRCQMCLRSDSLYKVMERLSNPGVRRLIVVEAGSKRVEGIVTLSDIFKFLIN